MPTTKRTISVGDPPAPNLTAAERRAAKIARWEARRAQRGRHSASNPLTYDIVGAGKPCGSNYIVTNAPPARGPNNPEEITHVED